MEKNDLKKLIILGMTSGILLAVQGQAHALVSEDQTALKSEELLAALSWTCRQGGCQHKSNHNNVNSPSQPNAGDTQIESYTNMNDNSDDYGAAPNFDSATEKQFISQLNAEGKKLYQSLNLTGKQLALRLSKQYADKNQAVIEAANQMSGQDNQTE